jgi:two-component system phosphate regulon sensor histidine kinase PhoR
VFLVGDAPLQVNLTARRHGETLEAAINSRYRRSVALGIAVLLLLVGAMAMVAISARNSARFADMRVKAAASQSHQLRNPLGGILLLADNLASGSFESHGQAKKLGEMILGYGRRLNEILDRSVQAASVESRAKHRQLVKVDVSDIAEAALEEAQPLIEQAGFVAERCLAQGLPEVPADEEALRQSLNNLLSNAVKYGLPGKWVGVETAETGSGRKREVLIRVQDRGRGIPAREARKIFEPYYRTADVASSPKPGSGLGLTLVRSAVKGMGGRLTLESEEGRGSVFTIHLRAPA